MSNQTYWKVFSLLALGAAWYIGDGLHQQQPVSFPQLSSAALAEGVTFASPGSRMMVTSSPDGKTIYLWSNSGFVSSEFVKALHATDPAPPPAQP